MGRIEGISYRTEEGEGTPIVFVHPWLGSKDSWTSVLKHLDIDNPKVFYDQRCHGESSCSKFDFEALAEDLKTLVEELGLEDPILVGHSMGGMVALTFAANYNCFSGLFLVGTSTSTPEPENHSQRFFLEKFGSMDRRVWATEIVKNYTGESCKPEFKDEARRELIEADDTVIIYSLGSMISYDVTSKLEDIDVPAAVISGKEDRAITTEKSQELADLLDCELHEIDCGHLMLWEAPEEIADLLSNFIQKHN